MIDSLKVFDILKAGHLPEEHARVMTAAIQSAESGIQADFEVRIRQEFEKFDGRMDLKLSQTKAELMRWMFIFWVTQFSATAALVIAVLKLAK